MSQQPDRWEGAAPSVATLHTTPACEISEVTGNPSDEGLTWELISAATCGATEFNVGVYHMGAGQFHPPHLHTTAAEFYLVTHGSCLVTVGDDTVDARAGTSIYIPLRTVHSIRTRPNEVMTMVYGFNLASFDDCGTEWVNGESP